MWETICDAQAGFWLSSKFLSKFSRKPLSGISDQKAPPFSRKPLSGISDQKAPPPPFRKTSDLRWPKFTPKYPPFWKTSDLRWPKFTPKYPPPFQKTSDLRWPKFTPEYPPPISENEGDRMWRLICNPQGYHSFDQFLLGLPMLPAGMMHGTSYSISANLWKFWILVCLHWIIN